MPELTDDRLAAILASVADHLVVPTPTADPSTTDTDVTPNGSGAGRTTDVGALTATTGGTASHVPVDPDEATVSEAEQPDEDSDADTTAIGEGSASSPAQSPGPAFGPSDLGDDADGPGSGGLDGALAKGWRRPGSRGRGRPHRRPARRSGGPEARGPGAAGHEAIEPGGHGELAAGGTGAEVRDEDLQTGRRGGRGAARSEAGWGAASTTGGESEGREAEVRVVRRSQRGRRMVVAAAVIAMGTVVGTVVAPVREAVAGWLGIGSTEIVRVPDGVGERVGEGDPSDLPYLGEGLVPVERSRAEQELHAPLPDTSETELGPAEVLALPPEGGVIMAWADGATTLWVRADDRPAGEIMQKLLTFDDQLEPVDELGDEAAIIEGPHVLGTPQRRLAAGTVIVWIDGGFEHRLESDIDPSRMVEIARNIDQG